MSKPQVLVFIDWYTPGFKAGGPVRSLVNLVDHLRDRIDFHIITSNTDYTETTAYAGITADRWSTLPGGEQVWYASRGRTNSVAWKKLLAESAWDAVYINGIYSRWSSIMPLWLMRGSDRRRMVAVRGMLAAGPMRHGALKKRAFLFAMKALGCFKGVEFQATSVEEVGDIKRWVGSDAVIHLVPNLPRKANASPQPARSKRPGELRLVSVGRIAVEKNTLFAIECLRHITGEVTFDLCGPIYDQAYWQQCRRAIATLPSNVKVENKGAIDPELVPALFADYHALFMPSLGENFGHSMAEALAAGLPLLISDRTPWTDLQEKHAGWDLDLSDPSAFERVLEDLVRLDGSGSQEMRTNARAIAEQMQRTRSTVDRYWTLLVKEAGYI